jgi:hypothetical protein
VRKYLLEPWERPLKYWYSTHGQIPLRTILDLNFLTAAHRQARFDVGVKIFILKFSWQIQWWTPAIVLQLHAVIFTIYPWWLLSFDGVNPSTWKHSFRSLQQTCAYTCFRYLSLNLLIRVSPWSMYQSSHHYGWALYFENPSENF